MTGQEKFDHAMSLKPFASPKDIPVFPHTCAFAAVPAGVTQAELFKGNDAWMDAYKKCCEVPLNCKVENLKAMIDSVR